MYLVIDTETTGLPTVAQRGNNYKYLAGYESCRVLQIAAALLDSQYNQIGTYSTFINTPIVCPAKALSIHKITDAYRAEHGKPMAEALDELAEFGGAATHIVAHNAPFDVYALLSEAWRCESPAINWLLSRQIICTLKIHRRRLAVWHTEIFGAEHNAAHDATGDVSALVAIITAKKLPLTPNITIEPPPLVLIPPSDEQSAIVAALQTGDVIVSAVAGSGKTTCALHIAASFEGNGLLLTYNKRLAEESRQRAVALPTLEIRTYHSFACAYLDRMAYRDENLITALAEKQLTAPQYQYIILDECQDMTPLLHQLALKLLAHCPTARLCIAGDPRQTIYKFKGADEKYLTPAVWPRKFRQLPLTTSYRISHLTANFVENAAKLTIRGGHDGPAPRIVDITASMEHVNAFAQIISNAWHDRQKTISVIMPSIRKYPNAAFLNALTARLISMNIPLHINQNDEADIDERHIKNKVCFTTIHQSKGLERDIVILMGVDGFWVGRWGGWQEQCPNEVYVAITRAKQQLYILASDFGKQQSAATTAPVKFSVTDLCRHLPSELIYVVKNYIDCEQLRQPANTLPAPELIAGKHHDREIEEDVCDLVGTAIPMIFGGFDFRPYSASIDRFIAGLGCEPAGQPDNLADTFRQVLYYSAWRSKARHRINQVKTFEWLAQETVDAAITRLAIAMEFEPTEGRVFESHVEHKSISGYIDVDAEFHVWELKYTSRLETVHYLQCALYAYMRGKPGILYNARTDECWKITPRANFGHLLKALLCCKKHGYTASERVDQFAFCLACARKGRHYA